MDEIRIENLKIYAYHGVYEEENKTGQDFFVNATLYTDTRKAGKTDALSCSVDYGEVCHFINDYIKNHTYQLIETVAEQTAQQILQKFPLLKKVDLEIRKPEAPIGLPFESVSVKIERGWHLAYVALGSNMGDKEGYIKTAVDALKANENIRQVRASSLIWTAPYGEVQNQEDFLNGMLELETLYTPTELLTVLHELEQNANRVRTIHWGPRTLDLDIIFYDDLVMDTKELTIPHCDMQNREFVLKPLCELAPYKRHPLLGKRVEELLKELENKDRA